MTELKNAGVELYPGGVTGRTRQLLCAACAGQTITGAAVEQLFTSGKIHNKLSKYVAQAPRGGEGGRLFGYLLSCRCSCSPRGQQYRAFDMFSVNYLTCLCVPIHSLDFWDLTVEHC